MIRLNNSSLASKKEQRNEKLHPKTLLTEQFAETWELTCRKAAWRLSLSWQTSQELLRWSHTAAEASTHLHTRSQKSIEYWTDKVRWLVLALRCHFIFPTQLNTCHDPTEHVPVFLLLCRPFTLDTFPFTFNFTSSKIIYISLGLWIPRRFNSNFTNKLKVSNLPNLQHPLHSFSQVRWR